MKKPIIHNFQIVNRLEKTHICFSLPLKPFPYEATAPAIVCIARPFGL